MDFTSNNDQPAVHAFNTGTGDGIQGDSSSGAGVAGASVSGVGIHGANHSASETAIFGINDTPGQQVPDDPNRKAGAGSGVWGHTRVEKGAGVVGSVEPGLSQSVGVSGINSGQGSGMLAHSKQGSGIVATSERGQGISAFSDNDTAVFAQGATFSGVFNGAFVVNKGPNPKDLSINPSDINGSIVINDGNLFLNSGSLFVQKGDGRFQGNVEVTGKISGQAILGPGGDVEQRISQLEQRVSQLEQQVEDLLGRLNAQQPIVNRFLGSPSLGLPVQRTGSESGRADISGDHFTPNRSVTLRVADAGNFHDDSLATATADANGHVEFVFTIPAGFSVGELFYAASDGSSNRRDLTGKLWANNSFAS